MAIKKHTIIKWMLNTMWVGVGVSVLVLLVAAVRKKDSQQCKGININIKGVNNICFVDQREIIDSISGIEGSDPVGEPIRSFNLKMMEAKLINNEWIKKVEFYFDNNEILEVNITEREPVARVFSTGGTTFYIDTSLCMLPLSEKFSARLLVFTSFPSDKKVLSKADSSLLGDIRKVSLAIQKDSFCMAFIDQVDITPQRTFELVPKIGHNIIVFGDATDVTEKLKKLKIFYKEIMTKAGWNYYSVINLQYKNEVVAKRKGADDKSEDSLRTIQMMQQIAANAEKAANDSLQSIAADNNKIANDSSIIQQSIPRDENSDFINIIEKPVSNPALAKSSAVKPVVAVPKPITTIASSLKPPANSVPVKKAISSNPVSPKQQPVVKKPKPVQKKKAVINTNNDY